MPFYILKILISAGVITAASELGKRSTTIAALLISLPLISILSFTWVYLDSRDALKVAELSTSTVHLVLPSLTFFLILSPCLRYGINFWLSLTISILATAVAYVVYLKALAALGIRI